jgi:hypothetical protein
MSTLVTQGLGVRIVVAKVEVWQGGELVAVEETSRAPLVTEIRKTPENARKRTRVRERIITGVTSAPERWAEVVFSVNYM